MFPNVALLGVVAAIDPGGIGVVAFFSRARTRGACCSPTSSAGWGLV
jgi:hypothetical protein